MSTPHRTFGITSKLTPAHFEMKERESSQSIIDRRQMQGGVGTRKVFVERFRVWKPKCLLKKLSSVRW